MEFTIQKTKFTLKSKEGKDMLGFAFIDVHGYCIVITYGESNLKILTKLLQE